MTWYLKIIYQFLNVFLAKQPTIKYKEKKERKPAKKKPKTEIITSTLQLLENRFSLEGKSDVKENREDIEKQGQYVAKYYLKRPTKIATVFINVAKVVKFCKILVTLEHTLVKPMLV